MKPVARARAVQNCSLLRLWKIAHIQGGVLLWRRVPASGLDASILGLSLGGGDDTWVAAIEKARPFRCDDGPRQLKLETILRYLELIFVKYL